MRVNWLIAWVIGTSMIFGALGGWMLTLGGWPFVSIQGPAALLLVALLMSAYWLADRIERNKTRYGRHTRTTDARNPEEGS